MFGAFYAGVRMPPADKDPHIPKLLVQPPAINPDPRPMVRRMFMPDSGPASIAVALSGRLNFCWDAGACRLRYFWEGGFIDAEDYFKSKGQSTARLRGKVWWRTGDSGPLRLGDAAPREIQFKGYSIRDGAPRFEYTIDGHAVNEELRETSDGGIAWRFDIPSAPESLAFVAPAADGIELMAPDGPIEGGLWRVPARSNGKFTILVKRHVSTANGREP
jgi:hypothetical protein